MRKIVSLMTAALCAATVLLTAAPVTVEAEDASVLTGRMRFVKGDEYYEDGLDYEISLHDDNTLDIKVFNANPDFIHSGGMPFTIDGFAYIYGDNLDGRSWTIERTNSPNADLLLTDYKPSYGGGLVSFDMSDYITPVLPDTEADIVLGYSEVFEPCDELFHILLPNYSGENFWFAEHEYRYENGVFATVVESNSFTEFAKEHCNLMTLFRPDELYTVNRFVADRNVFYGEFAANGQTYPYEYDIEVYSDSLTKITYIFREDVELTTPADFGKIVFSARQNGEEYFEGNDAKVNYSSGVELTAVPCDLTGSDAYTIQRTEDIHKGDTFSLLVEPKYDDARIAYAGDWYQLHIGGKSIEVKYQYSTGVESYATRMDVADFDSFTAPNTGRLGDANEDGNVDIMDVITLNKALLGGLSLSDRANNLVDFDKNGVNATDSLNLLKYVVELISESDLIALGNTN